MVWSGLSRQLAGGINVDFAAYVNHRPGRSDLDAMQGSCFGRPLPRSRAVRGRDVPADPRQPVPAERGGLAQAVSPELSDAETVVLGAHLLVLALLLTASHRPDLHSAQGNLA